jgi:hypothetical protein
MYKTKNDIFLELTQSITRCHLMQGVYEVEMRLSSFVMVKDQTCAQG